MNKTTTPADAEAWAAAQPIRHRTAKRPYIPLGCDQQGRVTPTLLDDAQLAPAEELQADQMGDINAGVWRWALISAAAVALVVTLVNCAPKP